MSYEDEQRKKFWLSNKDRLLVNLAKGKSIDLTKEEDLFFHFNRDRMSIEEQMNREKYDPLAKDVSEIRNIVDNKGWNKSKTSKLLGYIPNEIYFTHPWFSPNLSKQERDANIQKFFQLFPKFRI